MKPLLIFGLDGSSPLIMRRYIAEFPDGLFARIASQGIMTTLMSTWPYFTAPAWTSFATGLPPSWHGVYHWCGRYDAQLGRRPLISSQHLSRATFWSWVQENGGRVSVSNFPMEYPAPAVVGRYLCGTLAPEDAANTTWPAGMANKLRQALPNFRFEMDKGLSHVDQPDELRDHIDEVGDNQYAAMRHFCSGEFDLFCHVVTVTDRMQHFFWHRHEHDHPLAPAKRGQDPVLATYARAEQELTQLWESGAYQNLIIVSDHGMGASYEAFHADTWLVENGYATAGDGGKVDINRSAAYSAEEPECAIYMNRLDRDGIGPDAEACDRLITQIIAELKLLKRGDGELAFRDVFDSRDLHKGPKRDNAPDIILYPAHGVHPRPKLSKTVFSSEARLMAGHRPEGLLMLMGSDVPALGDAQFDDCVHMEDAFPLMCQLMGLPRPKGMPGRTHSQLCTAAPSPETGPDWPARVEGQIIPQNESASMMRRLKELGYAEE